jgi:hypothetical protein
MAGGILASTLGGAALGLTAVLAGFGMSGQQSSVYERQLEQGRTIVTVNAAGRYQEVLDILVRYGARWVDSTNTNFGADTVPGSEPYPARNHTIGHEPASPARPD